MSNRFKNSFVSGYSDEKSAKDEQAKSNTNSQNSNDGFSKAQLDIIRQLIVDQLLNGDVGNNIDQLFKETKMNQDILGCIMDENSCGNLPDH